LDRLFRRSFTLKETQCKIICDCENGLGIAIDSIRNNRLILEEFLIANPKFEWTLKPCSVPSKPLVANLMAQAAQKARVGPMAAVAGVLADLAVSDIVSAGCKVAIVENGGEVAIMSDEPTTIALAAGDEPVSKRFGFRIIDSPTGVATSSGRFSHALSFGDAEAVTIFCRSAGLADAAATATCNTVKGSNIKGAIERGLNIAKSIQDVEGAFVLYKGHVGTWGKIPQIIKVDPNQ
jgi:ApbE superfamily uncharacterized protein (UPF0280 family)